MELVRWSRFVCRCMIWGSLTGVKRVQEVVLNQSEAKLEQQMFVQPLVRELYTKIHQLQH